MTYVSEIWWVKRIWLTRRIGFLTVLHSYISYFSWGRGVWKKKTLKHTCWGDHNMAEGLSQEERLPLSCPWVVYFINGTVDVVHRRFLKSLHKAVPVRNSHLLCLWSPRSYGGNQSCQSDTGSKAEISHGVFWVEDWDWRGKRERVEEQKMRK